MENYWKQRCEAAEEVLETIPPDVNWGNLDAIKDHEETYLKWSKIKSQTPSPTGDRDCEELKEVEYSVYQLTQKYAEWVEETRGGSIYKFFEWLDFYNLTHK